MEVSLDIGCQILRGLCPPSEYWGGGARAPPAPTPLVIKLESCTILGNLHPDTIVPSPTATSVTITWTQPEFSLPVVGYTVTVTRVTGSGQALCPSFVEEDQSTTTSPSVTTTTFTGLQEFSSYIVRVTANFNPAFGLSSLVAAGNMMFITLSSSENMQA